MRPATPKGDVVLSVVEGLLALIALCAGGMTLVAPVELLAQQTVLPGLFLRLIGAADVVGAIGLILPELLHVRPAVTSVAAAGLVILMTSATVIILAGGDVTLALVPLVVGLLSAFVAYGQWRLSLRRESARRFAFQPAN
jgi:hypothetical protein